MGRKNVISKQFVNTTNSSASFESEVLNLEQTDIASIHLKWTGSSPNFTVTVQARNGDDKKDTFRDLDMGGTITISGASGEHELLFNSLPFSNLKLIFTRTSGTASISATFIAKSEGA